MGSLHLMELAQQKHSGFVCVSRLIIGKLLRLDTETLQSFLHDFLRKESGSKSRAFRLDRSIDVLVKEEGHSVCTAVQTDHHTAYNY